MTGSDRIVATYLVETPHPVEFAAEVLAGEQSSGTFLQVPGETEELKERHRARVVSITPHEDVGTPSLPGSRPPKGAAGSPTYHRATLQISFPFENVGANLPTLLATVTGNLFELSEFSGLRLLDLDLPQPFARAYPPPQFGIAGTRRLTGVYGRPIIGTIVKPSVGLSPAENARLVRTLVDAGIDFIKDDELMANPPHSPLAERVRLAMRVIDEEANRTGKKVMYAFNISDDLDAMRRHHDLVLEHGGTCIMASVNHVGVAGIVQLRKHSQLPIHGHRNGWGMLTRHPLLGMAFAAYQKIWRLAGVDHLHVNGLQNKFWEPDDSVVRSIQACFTPLFGGYEIMPVISSGQWAGQAPETYQRTETVDLIYLAGGGIMAHPGGPGAGVRSLQQAWDATARGVSLHDAARDHVELRQALEKYGAPR
jgi:ribulose-bisphosphate carboxylase large chain